MRHFRTVNSKTTALLAGRVVLRAMSTNHSPSSLVPMTVALFAILCLVSVTHAAGSDLTVGNPLGNQLPPIARVGQFWTWTPAPDTFSPPDRHVVLSTSPLPKWLAFNAEGFTLSGTPSDGDDGLHPVTVTAQLNSSSASSHFSVFVTKNPPPIPRISVAAQFMTENPSMSSVFFPQAESCLATDKPVVRIPSKWSFSIGFEYNTFEPSTPGSESRGIFYAIRQANGSAVPKWMVFNPREITLNGVTPSEKDQPTPVFLELQLHGSDVEGYTAGIMPFNLVVATHELLSSHRCQQSMSQAQSISRLVSTHLRTLLVFLWTENRCMLKTFRIWISMCLVMKIG